MRALSRRFRHLRRRHRRWTLPSLRVALVVLLGCGLIGGVALAANIVLPNTNADQIIIPTSTTTAPSSTSPN